MAVRNSGVIATQAQQAQNRQPRSPQTIQDYIHAYSRQLQMALPSVITPERFTRIALSAVSANPKLAECTKESFFGALLNTAQLGLEPNTPLGQAYLIPFYNGRTKALECQLQIGYKGLVALAYRSGQVRNIQARTVHAADAFDFEFGSRQFLSHRPASGERGEPAYYWASYTTPDGGFNFEVMSRHEAEEHARQFSQSARGGSSPWSTAFDAMAKKTVLKRLLKLAPLSAETARAVETDGTRQDLVMPSDSAEGATIQTTHVEAPAPDGQRGMLIDAATGEVLGEPREGAQAQAQ